MNGLDLIKKRRSVRSYRLDPVARNLLEKIVDAGRLAATAINIQPWEFIVIVDPARKKVLADITDHGKFIKDAGACIAVTAKDTKYYLEDGSAATENILLAATELGLGSCWVAGDKKPYADKVLSFLSVPKGYKLISLIAIGYPEGDLPNPAKRPLSEVLHWERF